MLDVIAVFPVLGATTVFGRPYWHIGGTSIMSPALARSKALLICAVAVFVALAVAVLTATTAPDVTVPPGRPEVSAATMS